MSAYLKQHIYRLALGCAVLLACICAGVTVHAKVFWTQSGPGALGTLSGWTRIYTTTVKINGYPGAIDIYGCDSTLRAVADTLRRVFSASDIIEPFQQNGAIGRGAVRDNARITRILALDIPGRAQTVVFMITQSQADYDASRAAPSTHRMTAIAPYPSSKPSLCIENEDTRTQLELSTAPQRPGVIAEYFDTTLRQDGYQPLSPGDAGTSGLTIYQKGASLCGILIQPGRLPGETSITLLHKRQRME